jgi:CspA family cold shock protein
VEQGIVKWFQKEKGWGFLLADSDHADVFVHYSAIEPEQKGFKVLEEGQKMEFERTKTPKGWAASNVTAITTT